MKVADVMTSGVISIAPTDSVMKAAHLMLQYDLSGFPVVEHGKLVGIMSEGDLLRRVEIGTEPHNRPRWIELLFPGRLAEEYARAHGRTVEEIMTRNVVSVSESASIEEAVRLMEQHHVKRLPVVRGEAVVGIISRADIVRAFIRQSSYAAAAPLSDTAICEKLMATLDNEPWAPRGRVNVIVEQGIVELEGVISDDRQRVALRIAAENIPGVKEVRDHRLRHDSGALE